MKLDGNLKDNSYTKPSLFYLKPFAIYKVGRRFYGREPAASEEGYRRQLSTPRSEKIIKNEMKWITWELIIHHSTKPGKKKKKNFTEPIRPTYTRKLYYAIDRANSNSALSPLLGGAFTRDWSYLVPANITFAKRAWCINLEPLVYTVFVKKMGALQLSQLIVIFILCQADAANL